MSLPYLLGPTTLITVSRYLIDVPMIFIDVDVTHSTQAEERMNMPSKLWSQCQGIVGPTTKTWITVSAGATKLVRVCRLHVRRREGATQVVLP